MNNDFFYREWGDTPTIITSDADTNEYHCWIPCQIVAESNRVSENSVFTVNHTSLYFFHTHYCDVVMGVIASQITSLAIVYSTVYSDVDQRKHQSSASLAFVRGIHRWPVNSPHKWPVTRKMFPFDDVIMYMYLCFEHATLMKTFIDLSFRNCCQGRTSLT